MEYKKPPLTFEDQASLIISRGLRADRAELINRLKSVNYYRLSGYWHPFLDAQNNFKDNTTLEKIWRRYTFDRQLRLLILDAIERLEVAIRTNLAYYHSHTHGPFGYTEHKNLPNITHIDHCNLINKISKAKESSHEIFVKHFNNKYGDRHSFLPIWSAAEIMTFGMKLTMYRGCDTKIQKMISAEYGIPAKVFLSWLVAINTIRNVCAHHGRIRDRILSYRPMIPRSNKFPEWHTPATIIQDRIFSVLTILKYMMTIIAPQSKWRKRAIDLIEEYPEIPILSMGMPDNWKEYAIWK